MPRMLIAVIDRVAGDILGPIQIMPHAAPAIRMFGDIASDQRTQVAQHPEDYELTCVGYLDDSLTIQPHREVLITGAQWKTLAQQRAAASQTMDGTVM